MASNADRQRPDTWSSGEGYEQYVGRWSRLVGVEFVKWLAVPALAEWLDIGCGTGALVETLLGQAEPSRVEGIDPSEGYVAHAKARISDTRTKFRVGDAQELPFPEGTFDAAIGGLVLNFVPDKERMLAEMKRVARSGGMVGVYVWDYSGEMQMMRRFWDAAVELDANAKDLDEGRRFPIARADALEALFKAAGLRDVEVTPIDVPTVFRNFDDYWAPFLTGEGPAPGYCMSLSEPRRAELRERLRSTLPTEADGSIHLVARAWAAKGRVP